MAAACSKVVAVASLPRIDTLRLEKCVLGSNGTRRSGLKLSRSGISCSSTSSSVLQPVSKGARKGLDVDPSTDAVSQLSYSFLHGEESSVHGVDGGVSDAHLESVSSPRFLPPLPPGGAADRPAPSYSSQLPWRDASLRHANVLWFKGTYNVQILCQEDESADSIVRRFRRAVIDAGVIGECRRRQFRETRVDTVRRKQRLAAIQRKKRFVVGGANAWKLSTEHLKRGNNNKKKTKKPRKNVRQRTSAKSEVKAPDIDDDYWGDA